MHNETGVEIVVVAAADSVVAVADVADAVAVGDGGGLEVIGGHVCPYLLL